MQETVFFLILCAILLALLAFSLLVMLATEYKRWIKFMEEQREYFRLAKIRKLREQDRNMEVQRRRTEHVNNLKQLVNTPVELPTKGTTKKNGHTRHATPAKA